MASTSAYASWPAMTTTFESSTSTSSPSPALDFLAAVATLDLEQYDIGQLGMTNTRLRRLDERAIGHGGFAVVERGETREKRPVAVKRIRTSAKDTLLDFGRQLRRICLELRILGHPPLRRHPNIVDVVGYCLTESLGIGNPFLALVLEYSSLGTLKEFLLDRGNNLPAKNLMSIVHQVASGLHALHTCDICHGDMKTQNVLVFAKEDGWTVKIADFGESVVVSSEDPTREVELSFGTRLLNAPETRTRFAESDTRCSIQTALLTDVFSFGLLTWEVTKRGSSYFDKTWCDTSRGIVDEYDMEDYLDALPQDGLLSKACDYVRSHIEDTLLAGCVLDILKKTLRDDPSRRSSMLDVCACLNSFEMPIEQLDPLTDNVADYKLCAWGTRHTVFQLYNAALHNAVVLEETLPSEIQELIVAELILLSDSESSSLNVRSHAAMCIAEFHCFGFGVRHDKQEVHAWVLKALKLGSLRALAYYPRICLANNIAVAADPRVRPSVEIEEGLSHLTSEFYLSNRIRSQVGVAIQHIQTSSFSSAAFAAMNPDHGLSHFGLFNTWYVDELLPLHVAALLGQDNIVKDMLQHSAVELQSTRGFTAIHFACIGGNLSTLEILLDAGSAVHVVDGYGVTPLHLCIFFSDKDVDRAATLLLNQDAHPNAECTSVIYWEYHDIELRGTPLEWATRTRHRTFTKRLLPYAQDCRSLKVAVENYFWEIAEDILEFAHKSGHPLESILLGDDVVFHPIQYPFSHWIAHGVDHFNAVDKTLRVFQDYKARMGGIKDSVSLFGITSGKPLEDNLAMIVHCAKRVSREEAKRAEGFGQTALVSALGLCKDADIWRAPLESLLDLYTVQELEADVTNSYSYLHLAVTLDTVLGTRLILERGVDVNQCMFTGDTALSLCRHTNREMFALLKEFGAEDNVPSSAGVGNLVVSNLNRSQAEDGIFQRTLGDGQVSALGEALHDTLNSVITTTIHDRETYSWSQTLNDAFLDIVLNCNEVEAISSKLEELTSDQLRDLKLMLNDDQLNLIRMFRTQQHLQHVHELSLTMQIGPQALDNLFGDTMHDVIGEGVTMRLLDLYKDYMDIMIEKGEPLRKSNDISRDMVDPDRSHQMQEALFRLQLGTDNAFACINHENEGGMTMMQIASYWLHYSSVATLLEAGADASIPFTRGIDIPIYPLQIACAMGRLYVTNTDLVLARLGKYSMEVARELLLWHHARSDDLFAGVTELHLACRMLMVDEIDRLRLEGCPDGQKGHWPGKEQPVLCQELAHRLPEDDFLLQYTAMRDSRLEVAEAG